jgi:hypothetical protein
MVVRGVFVCDWRVTLPSGLLHLLLRDVCRICVKYLIPPIASILGFGPLRALCWLLLLILGCIFGRYDLWDRLRGFLGGDCWKRHDSSEDILLWETIAFGLVFTT